MYKHNLMNSSFVVFSVCGFRAAHSVLNNQSGGSFPGEANSLLSNHCFVTCSPMSVEGDPLKISPFHTSMFMDKPLCVLVHVTVTHCLVIFVAVRCLVTAYLVPAAISTGRCFTAAILVLCLHDLSAPSSMTAPEPQMQNSEDDV